MVYSNTKCVSAISTKGQASHLNALGALGFGAASLGNLYRPISDQAAIDTVAAALATGVRYFDTAPHYGFGLSEQRLGAALKAAGIAPEAVTVSTKVGRLLVPTNSRERERHGFVDAPALEPVFDYSYDGVMRSFEESLQRLQLTRVDILLAHDLGSQTHGAQHPEQFHRFMAGGYKAMCELKAAGLVGAIGLGANEWQVCEEAMAQGDFDVFLLAGRYTLLEQAANLSFLPRCAELGVAVIAAGPFNSGILAPGASTRGQRFYNYAPAPAAILSQVARLEAVCTQFAVPLAAAALQFPAAHPQVATVLAGFASAQEVQQAEALMEMVIPAEFWIELYRLGLIDSAAPCPVRSDS